MKLVIKRSQQDVKGLLGGNKGVEFTLYYRLDLTSEELELVQRYRLSEYALTWKRFRDDRIPDDTIANMIAGRSQTVSGVTILVQNEKVIKDACDHLPVLFDVIRSFGGEEVIDYPRRPGSGEADEEA